MKKSKISTHFGFKVFDYDTYNEADFHELKGITISIFVWELFHHVGSLFSIHCVSDVLHKQIDINVFWFFNFGFSKKIQNEILVAN